MIKLIVFDWNSTLFADAQAVMDGVNAKMKIYGHPSITLQRYREVFEVPVPNMYKRLGVDSKLIEDTAKEAAEAFHNLYEKRAMHVRTRAGTREVLQYLTTHRIPKIILSNHTAKGIHAQLKRLKIAGYFDTVLANEDIMGSHYKGKKDRLIAYLETLHLSPTEIVIVGDSPEEVHIGKKLGLRTIALTGGTSTPKRLKAAKPDVLIHKLSDIIKVLEEF